MKTPPHPYLNATTVILFILYLVLSTLTHLQKSGVITIPEWIAGKFSFASLVIITFLAINLFLNLTVNKIFPSDMQPEEKIFYSKLYVWGLYAIGIAFVFYHLGVSLGNLTLFFGLITTGVAFALRDFILSFFSWVVLLRKKPFRIGDYIRIGEDEGVVKHIGTFYVTLDKTPDLPSDFTKIPNKTFLEKSIMNHGRTEVHERIRIPMKGIPPDISQKIDRLKTMLNELSEKNEYVSVLMDIEDDRLYITIEYLIPFSQRETARSQAVQRAFDVLKND